MSTLLDLVTDVKVVWKRDDLETMQPKSAVNDAYKAMLAVVGHNKLQDRVYKPIVKYQFSLSLPKGVLRINHPIKLIDPDAGSSMTGSFPLKFITKNDYDVWEPNPDVAVPSVGVPWGYALWKSSIYLTKIPNKTYTLEINLGGEPVDLLEPADESVLASIWDETIKAGALTRLFASVKLYSDADYWRKIYLNGSEGDGDRLVGGLNLLRQLETDNRQSILIVKNQPL